MKRLLVPLVFLACACAANHMTSDVQPGDAEKAIRRSNVDLVSGLRSGNLDRWTAGYLPSAVLLPPNMPALMSGDAIRRFWSGFLGTGSIDGTITTDDVMQSGDIAVESGHYEIKIMPKEGGAPVQDRGKYVVVWRKVDGQWKMARDIYNSDLPAPR